MFKNKKIISIVLLLSLMLTFFLPLTASAEESTEYSDVLEDLGKDESFNANDYPSNATDYSVNLIQVAEGENGELFVYVYQPSDSALDLTASYINMSTKHYEDITQNYKLYSLTLVNSNGVFDKYIVNDFTVSSDTYRYYNIATIYRSYSPQADGSSLPGGGDTLGHKGYAVGKFIVAYGKGNDVTYEAKKIDVVEVEIVSAGIVRYSEGYLLKQEYCDSHFVAFKVNNYDVKDVFDATITYTICDYSYSVGAGLDGTPTIRNEETLTVDITEYEKGESSGDGILGYDYEWPRIQTYAEFNSMLEEFENEKIVYEDEEIASSEFVFSFLETDYSVSTGVGTSTFISKRVTDVGILRLHFATDTGVYNLGAVSDLVSDDGEPDVEIGADNNFENAMEDFFGDSFSFIFLLILLLFILVLAIYLKPLFRAIGKGFKEIFSMIWSVITMPFQLIGHLFSNKRR